MAAHAEQPHIVSLVMNGVIGDGRVIKTARAAQDAGYLATLVGMTNGADRELIEVEGVPVILVPNGLYELKAKGLWSNDKSRRRLGLLTDSVMRAMLPVIEELGPSLLHSHDMSGLRIGAMVSRYLAAKGRDIPWVHDIHEYVAGLTTLPENYRTTCLEYERRYLRQADHLITVSDPLAEIVQSSYCLRSAPTVIYNAPLAKATPTKSTADIRSVLGVDTSAPLVVYIGVAKKERGCETIVSAVASLPGVHLCFVSDSADHLYTLKKLAHRLDMADRFRVLPYVPGSDITSFIRTADVGVHGLIHYPNGEVALPNKLFEYLHAGLPVAVSDVAAMKTFVEATGIGTVFEAENVASCASALNTAIQDGAKYRAALSAELKMGYSWEAQAEKLQTIYSRLLAQSPRSRTLVLASDTETGEIVRSSIRSFAGKVSTGVVSDEAPVRGTTDFYYDPTGGDDRAGLLIRLATRYETLIIHPSASWPDTLDCLALIAAGTRVVRHAHELQGGGRLPGGNEPRVGVSANPAAMPLRLLEQRQLLIDIANADRDHAAKVYASSRTSEVSRWEKIEKIIAGNLIKIFNRLGGRKKKVLHAVARAVYQKLRRMRRDPR